MAALGGAQVETYAQAFEIFGGGFGVVAGVVAFFHQLRKAREKFYQIEAGEVCG